MEIEKTMRHEREVPSAVATLAEDVMAVDRIDGDDAEGRALRCASETTQLLWRRSSIRKYKPDPVPDDVLMAVLEAARRCPTSDNLQAYSFIVVRDPATKKQLSELAGNQRHIVEAPVFVAICADLSTVALAGAMRGKTIVDDTVEMYLVASIDAALAGMCISLAAESLGLGSVMIGGMRNKALDAAQVLQLPDRCYVVFGLCLGWPDQNPNPRPRLPTEAVIHFERYQSADKRDALRDYDRKIARFYRSLGKQATADSWTGQIAQEFSQARRAQLRAELLALGFNFL